MKSVAQSRVRLVRYSAAGALLALSLGFAPRLLAQGPLPVVQELPRADGLPSLLSVAALEDLTRRVARSVVPLRAQVAVPSFVRYPVSPARLGLATLVQGDAGPPRWLVAEDFVGGADTLQFEPAGQAPCPARVLRADSDLGLVALAPVDPGACTLPPDAAALQLLPALPRSGEDGGSTLDAALLWPRTFLPPLPSEALQRVESVGVFGPAPETEAFFVLHSAVHAGGRPLVDDQARVVGLTCRPSLLRPGAGLALPAPVLREFLAERSMEGLRPHRPETTLPTWPPRHP